MASGGTEAGDVTGGADVAPAVANGPNGSWDLYKDLEAAMRIEPGLLPEPTAATHRRNSAGWPTMADGLHLQFIAEPWSFR